METLKRELRVQKLSFARLKTQVEEICQRKTINIESLSKLESLMSMYFNPLSAKIEDVTNQILMMLDPNDSEYKKTEEKYVAELGELYDFGSTYQGKIKSFHAKLSTEKSRQSIATCSSEQNITSLFPKLKEIEPPKFDGELTKFFEWQNLFTNLVHDNKDLTNVQKLYYLKRAMCKDAEGILDDFSLSDEAYAEAWSYVISRFAKKRSIILAHFRNLKNLEPLKDEKGIQKLLDKTNGIIRGLKAAGEKVCNTFSRYIAFHVGTKLDAITFRDWENSLVSVDNYPMFDELCRFLQNRAFAVDDREKLEKPVKSAPSSKKNVGSSDQKSFATFRSKQCPLCAETHYLNQCSDFLKKSPQDRFDIVKKNRLCLICFNSGHSANECNSRFVCKCGSKHHSLLHFEFKSANKNSSSNRGVNQSSSSPVASNQAVSSDNSANKVAPSNPSENPKSYLSCFSAVEKFVILPSALVKFVCGNVSGTCRILLDSCSQPNMISDRFVRKFKLPISSVNVGKSVQGVSFSPMPASQSLTLTIASKINSFQIEITGNVVPAPAMAYSTYLEVDPKAVEKLRDCQLADPAFSQQKVVIPYIDMIVGGEHYEQIVGNEKKSFDDQSWFLRSTQFGWIVSGTAPEENRNSRSNNFCGLTLQEIDFDLRRFWSIEEATSSSESLGVEADRCDEHFRQTHTVDIDGKFNTRLPFKIDRSKVANNRKLAVASLLKMENKLNEDLKLKYVDFMREYKSMGHMSLAEPTTDPHYFIPHRQVVRMESQTTPVRVVFNASSSSKGEISLNDSLMIGPNLQRDLFDILISMRTYKFCFTADIAKMYRMIWVNEKDRDMQRILWRENSTEPIREYRLNTITYGTGPASFIAQKCLQMVAETIRDSHPIAARFIVENFYMDDLICGADTLEIVADLRSVIHCSLAKYGFNLRKYSSNCPELLSQIDPELLAKSSSLEFDSVAVLGLRWDPVLDTFGVKVNIQSFESVVFTKRVVLSFVSRIFDPLGLVSPVTVRGKLILQALWLEGKSWDDPISESLSSVIKEYLFDLAQLSSFVIPRAIWCSSSQELVVFCDASEKAYCAVAYLRSLNVNSSYSCRLICSKNRVAPIRALTIPKLELCAAALLASLVDRIARNLGIDRNCIRAFSDSTIVLCWLSKPADSWKIFVGNRVRKIVDIVPFSHWHYVPSSHNPADLATRGLNSEAFLPHKMWTDGPDFLRLSTAYSHFEIPNVDTHNVLEKRKDIIFSSIFVDNIIDRFSSYTRLIRVVAYILRFYKSCITLSRAVGTELSFVECKNARNILYHVAQSFCFRVDMDRLRKGLPLKPTSSLKSLDPFFDENQVLRVGGRLEQSSWSFDKKHPIILSVKCNLARLIARHTHEKYFHAGRSFLAAFFSSQYWFIGGRTNLLKFVVRSCVVCTRLKAKTAEQLMGQLPENRITVSRPFAYVGIDLAGPFQSKCVAHRTTRYSKIYFAIFVCLTVRAIHIEIVSDLSSARFVEALQRFVARRGWPVKIFSDNATNFVGTYNAFEQYRSEVSSIAVDDNFEWSFIPPRAPHFGGIWESAVRSTKSHLQTVIRDTVLSFEEYSTLIAKIEAVLNSRPIAYKLHSEQGAEPITPAHFLIGQSLLVPPMLDSQPLSLSNRLQLVQNLFKGFWSRWSKDYLNHLQQRSKWTDRRSNLKIGQLVFVREDNQPPFKWPLGVVEKCHPGKDGCVRVVDIRCKSGIRTRALSSLVPLPDADEPPVHPGGANVVDRI